MIAAARNKITSHPKYNQTLHWAKLVSVTGAAQILVQAIGFISGILIVRLLPIKEYAFYTLANTMLGTMTVLSDGGISVGVMAQGGKVWQDKQQLGIVLATGLNLRRKFALGSLIISVPILFYLLLHHDASWLSTSLIALSLIPAFYAALSDSLLEIAPKLHQDILPLQKNGAMVSIARLLIITITIFIFPWTYLVLLANGLSRIWGNIKLRKISADYVDTTQKPDAAVEKNILKMVKRILPGAIYFALSGQINIWLISVFGNTKSIASAGALERFSNLLAVFSVLITTLVIPRFARLKENKILLFNKSILIISLLASLLFLFVVLVYFSSNQLLWILGRNYSGLNIQLSLSIIGACLTLLSGILFSMYSSRGWVVNPLISVPLEIISTVICICVFNLNTLSGVFLVRVAVSGVMLLLNMVFLFIKIKQIDNL